MNTTEVKRKHGLSRQYDVYEPWLKENHFRMKDLPLAAKTEDGEDVVIDAFTQDGEVVWKISTIQSEGKWIRVNYYYEDGTIEELYEH